MPVHMSYQPPRILLSRIHLGWAMCAPPGRIPSQNDRLETTQKLTNSITIKSETASHMAEEFSWVPLTCCSPPRHSFPIKFLALSARVSPQTIHFWVLDKSTLSGSGRDPPSCNMGINIGWLFSRNRRLRNWFYFILFFYLPLSSLNTLDRGSVP